MDLLRAVSGFLLVFFLPGFAWTLLFFRQVTAIERIVLSFGISVASVTLSLVAANLVFGLKITVLNAVLVILVLTILPIAAYYLNRAVKRRRETESQDNAV